jgi:tetratricopeptide (TPR) repeat protein
MGWWSRTTSSRSTSAARCSCRPAGAGSRGWLAAREAGAAAPLVLIALLSGAPRARAERDEGAELSSAQRELSSAYRQDRAEGLSELAALARESPGRLGAWLGDPDPRMRRAAARLLSRAPEPALGRDLAVAFVRERDPAVLDALADALARVPQEVRELESGVKQARDPRLASAFARLVRAVACDAIASKVRSGRVPGFYDGQFAEFWSLVPSMPEELLAIAYDDSYHLVVRVLAVMALHETRRPTLERELAGLVKDESDELARMEREARLFRPSSLDVLQRREYVLSRYARFSLAKAGQTGPILRLIRSIDEYLAQPAQRQLVALRGGPEENPRWVTTEFLRDLMFEVGYYYQQFDDYAAAERRYRELIERFPESRSCQNAHYNLACICAIQRRRREALDHLRAAIERGFMDHAWLREDGDLAALRGDPEFEALVELARTGAPDDSGRDWAVVLQRFLPAGTRSLFDLPPAELRSVLREGARSLTPTQRARLLEDAPPGQRATLEALLREVLRE